MDRKKTNGKKSPEDFGLGLGFSLGVAGPNSELSDRLLSSDEELEEEKPNGIKQNGFRFHPPRESLPIPEWFLPQHFTKSSSVYEETASSTSKVNNILSNSESTPPIIPRPNLPAPTGFSEDLFEPLFELHYVTVVEKNFRSHLAEKVKCPEVLQDLQDRIIREIIPPIIDYMQSLKFNPQENMEHFYNYHRSYESIKLDDGLLQYIDVPVKSYDGLLKFIDETIENLDVNYGHILDKKFITPALKQLKEDTRNFISIYRKDFLLKYKADIGETQRKYAFTYLEKLYNQLCMALCYIYCPISCLFTLAHTDCHDDDFNSENRITPPGTNDNRTYYECTERSEGRLRFFCAPLTSVEYFRQEAEKQDIKLSILAPLAQRMS